MKSDPGRPDPQTASVPEPGRRHPGGRGIHPNGAPDGPAEAAA
ncbi:hypothetical protein ACFC26_13865 [Kitasatospora purpeofusca]